MRRLVILAALLLASACGGQLPAVSTPPLPSATTSSWPAFSGVCMDGTQVLCAINPAVTQDTISTTICVKGWTSKVRPPVSYTEPLKLQQLQNEGLTSSASDYEEDHRLPLELGGNPTSTYNLSPEAHPESFTKDQDENAFHALVCSGKAGLVEAQVNFISKWLAPYPTYKTPAASPTP